MASIRWSSICARFHSFWAWQHADRVLRPTVDFLIEHGYSLDQLLQTPHFLSYTLENRIRPRLLFSEQQNQTRPSVYMLSEATDRDFTAEMGISLRDYREFARELKAEALRRSKHTSKASSSSSSLAAGVPAPSRNS